MTGRAARRALTWAREAMGGTVLEGAAIERVSFAGAAADSREVEPGQLFFALPGERVDGFEFCKDAADRGAAALVVAAGRGRPAGSGTVPVIAVADPRRALADVARAVRREFVGRVVGVTGSNGKTTTKELVAAALGTAGVVLRTSGNRNTDVGLPLTLLGATGDEDFWVLEMAMRGRGEIALLADIAQPHVGAVTNVAAAHLGRLGSLDEVARAKGEIFHGLAPGGIGVLPADDARLEQEAAHLPEARKRRFGGWPLAAPRADVRILDFVPSGAAGSVFRLAVGSTPLVVHLPLGGEHNARNAATAMAVVAALGLPLLPAAAALGGATLPPHRSRFLPVGGRTVLDDCYNANPASMSAALSTLAGSIGSGARTFAVLGDMLELGPDAEALHLALGREAFSRGVTGLVAVGPLAIHIARGAREAGMAAERVATTEDPKTAAETVSRWTGPGDFILVKASRGLRLERVVAALTTLFAEAELRRS